MDVKLNINQWAEEDRPREKLIQQGALALSNAELLAILIGSGNTEESAVELMRKVLDRYHHSLNELGKANIEDLCRFKGIGPAKAVTILAASELGKRRMEEAPKERKQIRCSKDIYELFLPLMCDLALLKRAVSLVLCHNHPSGNTTPSGDDDRLTQVLRQGASTMNIRLLDHLIVTDGAYYSYSDEGKL